MRGARRILAGAAAVAALALPAAAQDLAVRGGTVYTMAGEAIEDGVVIVTDGKIAAVGPAGEVAIPEGLPVLEAAVVTPGLVDAHSVVGLSGYLNQPHDQDQLERSAPIQPELRALDAYNAREPLVEWVRELGVTTLHTGHGPGALVSGETMIVKTRGETVEEAVLVPRAMLAATLAESALAEEEGKSPGTRGKAMAMLRQRFVEAREYLDRRAADDETPRDLALESLGRVLEGEIPLLLTADRHQDIASALRLAEEFGFPLVLDSGAESYLLVEELRAATVPVIVHAPMARAVGERENASMTTAARLAEAAVPVALQSGYEAYVPKTRVVLFEAAVAAAHGLGFEGALAAVTRDAARILGIADRVGTLEPGKDGDLALFDGDPFEYTSHCVATVIEGVVVHEGAR